ncbi:MAG TPA: phage portal protein, partial [Thermomicrobiales bacterium]|nr:phage portal protein [Thermomicrobiales bacterium]
MIARATNSSRRNYDDGPSLAQHYEGLKADYAAAKPSRFKRVRYGLLPYGSNADWHTRVDVDYYRIMEQVRDMDRNDVVIGQLVTRACVNTLQEGLTLDPQTGDAELDADLRGRWSDWAADPDQCDVRGELTFAQQEFLVLRQTLVDGDTLALLLKTGQIQLVEAHRLRKPLATKRNCVHGVLLDDNRKPLEYWLTKDEVNPLRSVNLVSDIRPYPARDADGNRIVCHVLDPTRVTQTRGFSALTPCIDAAGMFEDLNFANLVKAQ